MFPSLQPACMSLNMPQPQMSQAIFQPHYYEIDAVVRRMTAFKG
jgi:hypothetical protein